MKRTTPTRPGRFSIAVALCLATAYATGCGGGSRGTGVGPGFLNSYETNFMGEDAAKPGSRILRPEDDTTRTLKDPCPLRPAAEEQRCSVQLQVLTQCEETIRESRVLNESKVTNTETVCETAARVSRRVRYYLEQTPLKEYSDACRTIAVGCSAETELLRPGKEP